MPPCWQSLLIYSCEEQAAFQDWQKLVENFEQVLPASEYIEGMERLSRDITPLLSVGQQKQICTLSMQHHSRLQSQRQLHDNLQQVLDLAGMSCKLLYRASLISRSGRGLGERIAKRQLIAQICPSQLSILPKRLASQGAP